MKILVSLLVKMLRLLATKKLGAVGVISVAAHIYGEQMTQMYQAFAKADQK